MLIDDSTTAAEYFELAVERFEAEDRHASDAPAEVDLDVLASSSLSDSFIFTLRTRKIRVFQWKTMKLCV